MQNDNPPLSEKRCVPCEGGMPPLGRGEIIALEDELNNWNIVDDKKLEKTLKFKDFSEALAFVNRVGEIAENENHHPDIGIFGWNKVKISLTTHAIGGLSENDFILAAKIDEAEK